MNNRTPLQSTLMSFGPLKKVKAFSEWLKLHTTYGRLDRYNDLALSSSESGTTQAKRDRKLTVSLTSYAHRIHSVHLVVESLLRQTVQPDRIILWLSKDEFSDNTIPEILKKQQNRGLEVSYCDDLRSYKKIIPALLSCPEDILITADDDIICPHDHIERLYRAYLQNPDLIHCNRGHLMRTQSNGRISPYAKWSYETDQQGGSFLLCPTGCTGVLYTADNLHPEVTNVTAFNELAPHADDLWLKLMSVRRGIKSQLVPNARPLQHYLKVLDIKEEGLISVNRQANDSQLNSILQRYPDILALLNS